MPTVPPTPHTLSSCFRTQPAKRTPASQCHAPSRAQPTSFLEDGQWLFCVVTCARLAHQWSRVRLVLHDVARERRPTRLILIGWYDAPPGPSASCHQSRARHNLGVDRPREELGVQVLRPSSSARPRQVMPHIREEKSPAVQRLQLERVAHRVRRVLVQVQHRGDPDVEPRPPLARLGLAPRLRASIVEGITCSHSVRMLTLFCIVDVLLISARERSGPYSDSYGSGQAGLFRWSTPLIGHSPGVAAATASSTDCGASFFCSTGDNSSALRSSWPTVLTPWSLNRSAARFSPTLRMPPPPPPPPSSLLLLLLLRLLSVSAGCFLLTGWIPSAGLDRGFAFPVLARATHTLEATEPHDRHRPTPRAEPVQSPPSAESPSLLSQGIPPPTTPSTDDAKTPQRNAQLARTMSPRVCRTATCSNPTVAVTLAARRHGDPTINNKK